MVARAGAGRRPGPRAGRVRAIRSAGRSSPGNPIGGPVESAHPIGGPNVRAGANPSRTVAQAG